MQRYNDISSLLIWETDRWSLETKVCVCAILWFSLIFFHFISFLKSFVNLQGTRRFNLKIQLVASCSFILIAMETNYAKT